MTHQAAEEVPTTVSDVMSRLRDAAPEVDLDRIRDTASSALDTASSALETASAALPSIDLAAGRKAVKKRARRARRTAAKKANKSKVVAAKKVGDGKATLRERVFGWPLYSVALAGAALGSLAWWRNRQRPTVDLQSAPPSEINIVDPVDAQSVTPPPG